MTRTQTRTIAALAVSTGVLIGGAWRLAFGADDEPAPKPSPVEARAVLERLKSLAGTWVFRDVPEGLEGGKVIYRITAGGSAVVEEQFAGADHEMVSVYHLDGDDLLMTHYCAAGNQPRLKLDRAKSTGDDLYFAFDGGTNLDPAKDIHIHEAVLHLGEIAQGRLTSDWVGYQNGEPFGTTVFTLGRE